MKQVIIWIAFFVLCVAVIAGAVQAGITHHHCHECMKGLDKKAGDGDNCICITDSTG